MDNSVFQTNYKGQLLKSWIIQYDEDAVHLEIFYPYKGLSLRHKPGPGKEPDKLAKFISIELFTWCQHLEKEMRQLKDIYFEYQAEREQWMKTNPAYGGPRWYDKYLAEHIPFEVPTHCKFEIIEYIGKHRQPVMSAMVYIPRQDDQELIDSFYENDIICSNDKLISLYNRAQAKGFFGAHAQGCRVIAMDQVFRERFGKSPVQITGKTLLQFSGPIRAASDSWEHV